MDTIYQDFANAIVMQAIKDYRKALHQLTRNPRHAAALMRKLEIPQFFRSDWYTRLTNVDPETLITRLNGEAKV